MANRGRLNLPIKWAYKQAVILSVPLDGPFWLILVARTSALQSEPASQTTVLELSWTAAFDPKRSLAFRSQFSYLEVMMQVSIDE